MPAGYGGIRNNPLAIAALVSGCAQFVLWWIVLIPGFLAALTALILGVVSMRQINARGEAGKGMAIAGVVLCALGVLGGIIVLVLLVAVSHSTVTYGGY